MKNIYNNMKKRGVSVVVATVLIILIVVAAVAILWIAVLPLIRQTITTQGIETDLNIETSGGYTGYDSVNNKIGVQVRRGSDDANIIGLQFVFVKGGDSHEVKVYDSVPEKNEVKLYTFTETDVGFTGVPDQIKVAPIFENDEIGSVVSSLKNVPEDVDLSGVGEDEYLECGTKIIQDGITIQLKNDLLNCPSFGILIDASDVTIDCQGHEISGVGNSGQFYNSAGKEDCSISLSPIEQKVYPSGVVICRGNTNYHIKNCVIHDFSDSIGSNQYGGGISNYAQHSDSTQGIIENNHIYNCLSNGLIQWGEFDIIRNNTFENNPIGLFLDESSGNLVENNLFENNYYAIEHYCGSYCDYKENPSNIISNTFVDNNYSVWAQIQFLGGFGKIRDNIIENDFTNFEPENNQFFDLNNPDDVKYKDVLLYFEGNTYNEEDLNPAEDLNILPDYISETRFI